MRYMLMHKRTAVALIEINDVTDSITQVLEVYNPLHFPVGVSVTEGIPDARTLAAWWAGRTIPTSRSGLRDALETLNLYMSRQLLVKSMGLSLSDQYWIRPENDDITWDQVNFFDNAFSEDVGYALFGKTFDRELDLMSPDNTTVGILKKRWAIMDGERTLIKGGSVPYHQEPLNEALASAVMRRIGTIDYVPYRVIYDNGTPLSLCSNFITPDTELVTAWEILQTKEKPSDVSRYDHYIDCCATLGIPGITESLDRMMAIDYIIVNTDRHFGNFGAVRNAETLEWIKPTPIFDCGTSMWHNQLPKFIEPSGDVTSRPFHFTHKKQIRFVTSFDWLDFDSLDVVDEEFSEILKASPHIDEPRRTVLCRAVQSRVEQLHEVAASMIHNSHFDMNMT